MATIRKPARCETCGGPLRNYAVNLDTKDGRITYTDAPACRKCRRVFRRPVCYGKATLELATDATVIAQVMAKIAPKAIVLEGEEIEIR